MSRTLGIVIFIVATLALESCNPIKDTRLADAAVAEFHKKLDRGAFGEIYSGTNEEFKAATKEQDFVSLLEAVHRKLGSIQSSERFTWRINSFNLKTNITLVYKTKFQNGEATETFVWRAEKDGVKLLGYNISSLALITK